MNSNSHLFYYFILREITRSPPHDSAAHSKRSRTTASRPYGHSSQSPSQFFNKLTWALFCFPTIRPQFSMHICASWSVQFQCWRERKEQGRTERSRIRNETNENNRNGILFIRVLISFDLVIFSRGEMSGKTHSLGFFRFDFVLVSRSVSVFAALISSRAHLTRPSSPVKIYWKASLKDVRK